MTDLDTDTGVWVWDHSGEPINWNMWDPVDYEPDGGNLHDHVFFRISREGLEDDSGSFTRYFLCETAANDVAC